jgi:hypothetical protein
VPLSCVSAMSRQRDIFPLPRVGADFKAPPGKRRRINSLIQCLNEMQGLDTPHAAPIAVQERAQVEISRQFAHAAPFVSPSFDRAAAEKLLRCSLSYLAEEQADSPVVPFDSARVSIPFVGHSAASAAAVLDSSGREVLEGFSKHMLHDPESWGRIVEEGECVVPYMAPPFKAQSGPLQ